MEAPAAEAVVSNVPEFTVSELSLVLKREIETAFPRVRVRGEISQPSFPRSGHCYFRLKDENAVLDGVCWKTTLPRLGLRIEEGMEVIATGRLTTYAGSSRYQIIVDRLELAGEGALLKLLEDRRKKLQAEGLFEAASKRALPFLPEVVGVVTSPSGAVIRDILHRLSDRFTRHVLLWPVAVQGERAAVEVAGAIAGFNRLPHGGPVPRPDVLIVARGGGSLEDLWAFNEEIVVRAAAASTIPLISAVGHETDTTLIDFASDRRAPTPTAAAEMAVPVRGELVAQTLDFGKRTITCINRLLREANVALTGLGRGLGDPLRLLEERQQRIDVNGERLVLATRQLVDRRTHQLAAARLVSPTGLVEERQHRLDVNGERLALATGQLVERCAHQLAAARLVSPMAVLRAKSQALAAEARLLDGAMRRYVGDTVQKMARAGERLEDCIARVRRCIAVLLERSAKHLEHAGQLLESYSFHSVLNRGFALVRDQDGHPVLAAAQTTAGETVSIEFADARVGARITDGVGPTPRPAAPPRKRGGDGGNQGTLL
ncbi:MAG: exodeoxyribonuclease VII large subunit [Alphaproteobacteria bacterium]|nr:exodeoxyribonuclease VII large subunit [Alphaproteobacteria bacterium]